MKNVSVFELRLGYACKANKKNDVVRRIYPKILQLVRSKDLRCRKNRPIQAEKYNQLQCFTLKPETLIESQGGNEKNYLQRRYYMDVESTTETCFIEKVNANTAITPSYHRPGHFFVKKKKHV